ncbi:MAG: 4-vinyl reductase [Chloroflexota bacterium]
MSAPATFYYPNRMGRIILSSLQEVVGRNGLQAALHLAGLEGLFAPDVPENSYSFQAIGALQEKLERLYGPRGGRGLALRAGRVCFKYGLREFGLEMGLTETAFRLLPMPVKVRTAGRAFADLFNKHTDQIVSIEEGEEKLIWRIERCPLCWERRSQEPVCHLAVGLLQESLYWLSGGKIFNVQETQCVACGDPACVIEIDAVPLD